MEPIDLSTQAFWDLDAAARDAAFAVLRRERPVARFRARESPLQPGAADAPGFWAVTRHADVRAASRAPERFSSAQGVVWTEPPRDVSARTPSFLSTDPPRHTRLRGLVQAAFTPRRVARMEAQIATLAAQVVDELLEAREGDFVELCAAALPMRTINAILGVPAADRARLAHAADVIVGVHDPELAGDDPLAALRDAVATLERAWARWSSARASTCARPPWPA